MANITDVARHTGLGYSTVAQILQGRQNYRQQTIDRVKTAARELGYVPNYLGKSLAGGRSMLIGVYLESLARETAFALLYPLERELRRRDYQLYISSGGPDDQTARNLREMANRKIDGLIFHSTAPHSGEIIDLLQSFDFPIVYIDLPVVPGAPASVKIDDAPALELLAKRLSDSGYRSAQLVGSSFFQSYPGRMILPYRSALEKHGIALYCTDDWFCQWAPAQEPIFYDMVAGNLRGGNIPEVLLCHNDRSAMAAMAAAKDCGLRVPEDIGIVGRNGDALSTYTRPPLTTLRCPGGETIVSAATEMLLKMVADRAFEPVPVRLAMKFVPGETIK